MASEDRFGKMQADYVAHIAVCNLCWHPGTEEHDFLSRAAGDLAADYRLVVAQIMMLRERYFGTFTECTISRMLLHGAELDLMDGFNRANRLQERFRPLSAVADLARPDYVCWLVAQEFWRPSMIFDVYHATRLTLDVSYDQKARDYGRERAATYLETIARPCLPRPGDN